MTDETQLNEMAQKLGAEAADGLDLERTAAAVVERLRREPARGRSLWTAPAWLRIAAAMVVLLGSGLVARGLILVSERNGHAAHFVTDDLRDLSAEQLAEVLATLDETLDLGGATRPGLDLEDLNEQQLRAVLRSLEG